MPYPVILVGVAIERCPECGEEAVTIPDPEELHRQIALSIIGGERPIIGAEIRFLRKLLDKSAADMADMMGVDSKTLSRWENSRQKMGKVAERLLRLLVHQQLVSGAVTFAAEVFPRISDEGEPRPVRLTASKAGWEKDAA